MSQDYCNSLKEHFLFDEKRRKVGSWSLAIALVLAWGWCSMWISDWLVIWFRWFPADKYVWVFLGVWIYGSFAIIYSFFDEQLREILLSFTGLLAWGWCSMWISDCLVEGLGWFAAEKYVWVVLGVGFLLPISILLVLAVLFPSDARPRGPTWRGGSDG
jgi:hypothetical protein